MNLKIENGILTGYAKYPDEDTTEITLPEQVTGICNYTFFHWKSLRTVSLPSKLKSIDYGAFEGCRALEEIIFPDSLEHIGHCAFWSCISLKEIIIPEQVKHIGYGAFASCMNLEKITVSENNPYFTSLDGVLYNKDFTELYCCPAGKKKIKIPETVVKVRKFAFCGCRHLTEIRIPASVKHIQYGAFRQCTNLKEILIPVTVLQCENPDFPLDTLVSVQGKSGVMTYQPSESHHNWPASYLVLERDFSVRFDRNRKYDLIFRMFFAGIFGAEDYVKKNFSKMFRFLIDNDKTEEIRKILEMQKFISKRNINSFIRYADENSHSECWEILSDYKKEHLS
ncbi:MAG: leucine-rich repeat domain-containing protein [Oscillospiraceae bacterium]|nr:leucine-rich repeat domain-containing protein [Oscillospiraceae bacterium]